MKDFIQSGIGICARVANFGDFIEIRIGNSKPTFCMVEVYTPKGTYLEREASLGQLRAAVTEMARAFNIIVDLQRLNAKKITVDGKTPE